MAAEFTESNWKTDVLGSKKPVLVDFWAPWCPPCKMVGPIVEKLSAEMKDTITIGKLNVDEAGAIAGEYDVTNIPAMLIFKDGKVVGREVGFKPEPVLRQFIAKTIGAPAKA